MKSIASLLRPAEGNEITHVPDKQKPNLLMGILLAVTGVGMLAMLAMQHETILSSLASLHHQIGLAFVGLVPLTVLTAYLGISVISARGKVSAWASRQLTHTAYLAGLLASYATVERLANGVHGLIHNQGADGLLQALPDLAGAIYAMCLSNAWAIALMITAGLIKWFGIEESPTTPIVHAVPNAASDTESRKEIRTAGNHGHTPHWQRSRS